jgi:hypothetical protein
MGARVKGLDEVIHMLETLEERADKKFPKVVGRGALNIKLGWKQRWKAIAQTNTAIPHLIRGVGYDTTEKAPHYTADIGVIETNPQAPLAHIITYGTLGHNPPHDAGLSAMDEEDPKFVNAVATAAVELLDE